MNPERSDALVFFGATGDLAFKKIFPALYAMTRAGQLDVPVIGVARSGWSAEQFRARARQSVEQGGKVDEVAFASLAANLRYVQGEYETPDTYVALRSALGAAAHPLHYLAVPPIRGAYHSGKTAYFIERPGLGTDDSPCGQALVIEVPALQTAFHPGHR